MATRGEARNRKTRRVYYFERDTLRGSVELRAVDARPLELGASRVESPERFAELYEVLT
jgi:hypothetical protein